MALSFAKLVRAEVWALKRGQKIAEHGIIAERIRKAFPGPLQELDHRFTKTDLR